MRNNKRKNNIIIGGLLAIVLVMGIGYAAFSSKLSINGTGSVSSDFDVKITKITSTNIVGTASDKIAPTYTDTTATFYTTLQSPGDSITYEITVSNSGTLDATVDNITTTSGNNDAITFTTSGLSKGDAVLRGESKILTLKVAYNKSITSQPSNTTNTLKVSLNFSQKGLDSSGIATIPASDQILQKENIVTSGDGLYKDGIEDGRYIYKGANPNNYIKLGEDMYRIISTEKGGELKVMKTTSVGNMLYDEVNERYKDNYYHYDEDNNVVYPGDYYCAGSSSTYGCNLWGSITTTLDTNGNNITKYTTNPYGGGKLSMILPNKEASSNVYLNTTWYNTLSESVKKYITTYTFNVGMVKQSEESYEKELNHEKTLKWKGKIGLMSVSDYTRASINPACTSPGAYSGASDCFLNGKTHNWIYATLSNEKNFWLINPYEGVYASSHVVQTAYGNAICNPIMKDASYKYEEDAVVPAFYLSSTIKLKGTGTSTDPYVVVS